MLACVAVCAVFPVLHEYCDSGNYIGCSLNWLWGGMLTLTFPLGLIHHALACGNAFPCGGEYNLYHAFLYWLGMLAVGYVQWFLILPRLFRGKEVTRLSIGR